MCRGNAAACSAAARDKPVHANARAEGARQGASTFSKAYASSAFVRVTHRRFHDTPIRAPRFCSEPCLPSARCQLLSSRALVLRITRPRESSPACASAGQAGAGAWRGGKWSGRRGQLGAVSGCAGPVSQTRPRGPPASPPHCSAPCRSRIQCKTERRNTECDEKFTVSFLKKNEA